MKEYNIISVWHTSRVITSNVPRQRPNCPKTPASSRTSRRAVTAGSSSGSTPPPGTIQLSGLRLDVTSNTCKLTLTREESCTSERELAQLTREFRSINDQRDRLIKKEREAGSKTTACRRRLQVAAICQAKLTSSSRSLLTQIQAALRLYPSES